MKLITLIGGCLGFGIGLFFSQIQQCQWPTTVLRAAVGAYLGGLLFRWYGRAWRKSLGAAIVERRIRASKINPVPKGAKS